MTVGIGWAVFVGVKEEGFVGEGVGGWRMMGRMTSSLTVSQKKSWWHDAV